MLAMLATWLGHGLFSQQEMLLLSMQCATALLFFPAVVSNITL